MGTGLERAAHNRHEYSGLGRMRNAGSRTPGTPRVGASGDGVTQMRDPAELVQPVNGPEPGSCDEPATG